MQIPAHAIEYGKSGVAEEAAPLFFMPCDPNTAISTGRSNTYPIRMAPSGFRSLCGAEQESEK